MPYIKPEERVYVDPLIDQLADKIIERSNEEGAYAGLLNYTCTRLVLKVVRMKFGKIRYHIVATVTGVFHNIADEFDRRIVHPYEKRKKEENTDVDLYKIYEDEILGK